MTTQRQDIKLIDYHQENASNAFVPRPAILVSHWDNMHIEVHQQPSFDVVEHQHTMHVIVHGLESSSAKSSLGERWLDGKIKRETRHLGDVAIIPAGISHRCNWNTDVQFMILAIEPALLKQVAQDLLNPDSIELMPQFMTEQDTLTQGIFDALKEELEFSKIGSNFLIDSLKNTLTIHLLRKYCTIQPKIRNYTDGLSKLKLQEVTDYINEHIHQDIKLMELSTIAQISLYHFLRLFHQSMGVTPHQYILQHRIEKAKYLLQHSGLSISEVAVCVGFCDQSHLTKYFKRIVGVTPKKYLLLLSQ